MKCTDCWHSANTSTCASQTLVKYRPWPSQQTPCAFPQETRILAAPEATAILVHSHRRLMKPAVKFPINMLVIQYTLFCVKCLSVKAPFWKFTHVLHVSVTCSFLLWSAVPLYKCTLVYPLYQSTSGPSVVCGNYSERCDENPCTNLFVNIYFLFLSGKSLGVEMMGHKVGVFCFTGS